MPAKVAGLDLFIHNAQMYGSPTSKSGVVSQRVPVYRAGTYRQYYVMLS